MTSINRTSLLALGFEQSPNRMRFIYKHRDSLIYLECWLTSNGSELYLNKVLDKIELSRIDNTEDLATLMRLLYGPKK